MPHFMTIKEHINKGDILTAIHTGKKPNIEFLNQFKVRDYYTTIEGDDPLRLELSLLDEYGIERDIREYSIISEKNINGINIIHCRFYALTLIN